MASEMLPVPLKGHEVERKASDLAQKLMEYRLIEEEKKTSAKVYGDRLKESRRVIDELGEEVRTRSELRLVETHEIPSPTSNVILVVRNDTMETVRTRPMTEHELEVRKQRTLFDGGREDDAAHLVSDVRDEALGDEDE